MTTVYGLKIDLIMCEPHCAKYFFLQTWSIVQLSDFWQTISNSLKYFFYLPSVFLKLSIICNMSKSQGTKLWMG